MDAKDTVATHAFDTRVVHVGRDTGAIHPTPERPDGRGRPVAPGIQVATSFAFDSTASLDHALEYPDDSYSYARISSPTTDQLARAVADLEGLDGGVPFGSGMAAVHAALLAAGLKAGETVVASRDVYGATHTLLGTVLAGQGVVTHIADFMDTETTQATIARVRPRVVFAETISNPLVRVADLAAIGEAAASVGAIFIVDNTFPTPYLYRPGDHGAHMVVHSATKYIGGHGDLTAGVVAARHDFVVPLRTVGRLTGATMSPFDAWLGLRGLRTLSLRMERHFANAMAVATALEAHPRVAKVHYPGLASHQHYALATGMFGTRGYGAMLAFEVRDGGVAEARAVLDGLRLILPGPTLGDVYTLAMHPASASHRSLAPEDRAKIGIVDGLIRVSVGIENARDLIADLDHALTHAHA
jgi:cystathionine beta-lyase/cystathionine gamma-synthase